MTPAQSDHFFSAGLIKSALQRYHNSPANTPKLKFKPHLEDNHYIHGKLPPESCAFHYDNGQRSSLTDRLKLDRRRC
jgi:hypothetical protein